MGFKDYKSKPVVRRAYQVQPGDKIETVAEGHHVIQVDGEDVFFQAYDPVMPFDYIVYLNEDDIYHCNKEVFEERNYVDS